MIPKIVVKLLNFKCFCVCTVAYMIQISVSVHKHLDKVLLHFQNRVFLSFRRYEKYIFFPFLNVYQFIVTKKEINCLSKYFFEYSKYTI